MTGKIARAVLCLLVVSVAAACAETMRITESNYAALGWKKTIRPGREDPGYVRLWERRDTTPPAVPGVECAPRGSASGKYAWAGISTGLLANKDAKQINWFRMRTCCFEGDGTTYQPPTVRIVFYNGAGGYRGCTYLPWVSPNPRGTNWTFYEYDLLAGGMWEEWISGYPKSNWQTLMAKYPEARFCTDEEVAYEGTPGGQSFVVASGCRDYHELQFFNSARGMVDWVEIGFTDGTFYRFEFGVPDYALNNKAAKDPIIAGLDPTKRYLRHVVFGKIVADPAPDVDYFYIDDGAGTLVRVNAVNHGHYIAGEYVRAAGFLRADMTPPQLYCSASDITPL